MKIQKEKVLSEKQLLRRVHLLRMAYFLYSPFIGRRIRNIGREMFLNTDVGKVRVLCYNMDNKNIQPVYVNMHGGGFVMGNPDTDDRYMADLAKKTGIKIINVDYSLSPEAKFPEALKECYGVAKYLKEHSGELCIDPDNISVGGFSAGGNLSAAISILDAELKLLGLKCVIMCYASTDRDTDPYMKPKIKKAMSPKLMKVFQGAYHKKDEGKNPLVSPIFASIEQLKKFPTALLITAELDSLANEVELFRDKLTTAGVNTSYKKFMGCSHGFTHYKTPEAEEAWQLMAGFLKDNFFR